MSSVEVSVVIPTHDRLGLLQRTLATVLRQEVDLEVIVVDDGSTDSTADWLRAHPDRRVRIVRHDEPRGPAHARNAGIDAAVGTWVAFVDDDDRWAPDKLASQLSALAQQEDCGWSICGAVWVDERERVVRWDPTPPGTDLSGSLVAGNVVPGGASGVVARTELVREVGRFDATYPICADWDLWIRLALRSGVAAVDRPLVAYLVHPHQLSTKIAANDRERAGVLEKYREDARARGIDPKFVPGGPWTARMYERDGKRLAAAWSHLSWGLRRRETEELAQAVRAFIAPRRVAERHARQKFEALPASWRAELATWLWTGDQEPTWSVP